MASRTVGRLTPSDAPSHVPAATGLPPELALPDQLAKLTGHLLVDSRWDATVWIGTARHYRVSVSGPGRRSCGV